MKRVTTSVALVTLMIIATIQVYSQELRKGPYLILPEDNTSMTVLWWSSTAASNSIAWYNDAGYLNQIGSGSSTTLPAPLNGEYRQSYTVTGLNPGTKYYYRVTVGVQSREGSFTTAPSTAATSTKFIVYTDPQASASTHNIVAGNVAASFSDGYQTLLVCSGDLTNDQEFLNSFFDWSDGRNQNIFNVLTNVPFQSAFGNHDGYYSGPPDNELIGSNFPIYLPYPFQAQPQEEFYQRNYYSFDYGPAHITVVNYWDTGTMTEAQRQWVINDLSSSDKPWKFINVHVAGYVASGVYGPVNYEITSIISDLNELNIPVAVVFGGHYHFYSHCEYTESNGFRTKHITNATAASELRTAIENDHTVTIANNVRTFSKVDIINEGLLYLYTIDGETGGLVETITIDRPQGIEVSGVSATTAEISWLTALPSSSNLIYGTSTSYGLSASGDDDVLSHSVTLSGLSPNTTYHFRVESDGERSMDYSFTTNSTVSWHDPAWQNRIPVSILNPGETELVDFQVKVTLSSGNFDFGVAEPDGSDIRITTNDGKTLIPFWIETWTSSLAEIWVKVPSIPTDGTGIYIYYGNNSPMPPVGPFTRAEGNPIVPLGSPEEFDMLAENIVYDEESGRYYMCLATYHDDYGAHGASLCYSYTPEDAESWVWVGDLLDRFLQIEDPQSIAPHLIKHDGTWYLFYADKPNIKVATASTIEGPYSVLAAPALVPSGPSPAWDNFRVDEPYVFQRDDGKWVMFYMGDASPDAIEQVGYATADNITGPYTAYEGNPVIRFGEEGSFDAGTIADPWVYKVNDTYYIGYTAGSAAGPPWSTACATTTDWETFTKLGLIFPVAEEGWDAGNSFRGALSKVGNKYLLSYTGGGYEMGVAFQDVYGETPVFVNNPDYVFDLYDDFNGISLNTSKWAVTTGQAAQAVVSQNYLNLASTSGAGQVVISGISGFGSDYLAEYRARHPHQGTLNMISAAGFSSSDFANSLQITDGVTSAEFWQRQTILSGTSDLQNMSLAGDHLWHLFTVIRQGSTIAGFQVDDNAVETSDVNVPSGILQPFLKSSGEDNEFRVDWFRVRKWADIDPIAMPGEEQAGFEWTGAESHNWSSHGNWYAGYSPGEHDKVLISDTDNDPVIGGTAACRDLTIESAASLTVNPDGALTIFGNLDNSGNLVINSSGLSSSGSLIVAGSGTGIVTYNRTLDPSGYHYFSSPVAVAEMPAQVFTYDEPTDRWIATSVYTRGKGYAITGVNTLTFSGELITGDVRIHATSPYSAPFEGIDYSMRPHAPGRDPDLGGVYGGGGWNLIGNPYSSSLNVAGIIDDNYNEDYNLSKFDPNYVALYLFDGSSYQFVTKNETGWDLPSNNDGIGLLNATHIQAGQGFFILAMNDGIEFTFTNSMQEHSTGATLLKSAKVSDRWPGLALKVRFDDTERQTLILFKEGMSSGLDPVYDVGLMSSAPVIDIYTLLAEDNGVNFARQALPEDGAVNDIIPVGIDFAKGGIVTLSAETEPFRNYKFWLEDRMTGIFTDLGKHSYTVLLPAKTYGTGRFFVHVSTGRAKRSRNEAVGVNDLRIWTSQGKQVHIQGAVSETARCQIFDVHGKLLHEQRLTDGEYNSFYLSWLKNGVYLVQISDVNLTFTQRVVLL